MKKIFVFILSMVIAFPLTVKAQEIRVKRFEVNPTSMLARMNQVHDNAGEVCAVIRCYVMGDGYTIEPNMGVLKTDTSKDGEIRLWVPQGTKRITVRHKGTKPLSGYTIPIRIESKMDYEMDIELSQNTSLMEPSRHNVYVGAGYNIMSISGPSLTIGANINHHIIELGAVYGLNKTDSLFFFGSEGDLLADIHYKAINASLTYGYEFPISDFFSITPMFGGSYNAYVGEEASGISKSSKYKNANSISIGGGVRLTLAINRHLRLCVTPKYQTAVYKDETCELVSKYDDNMKKWHTGFNLNVGLMVYF